MRVLIAGTQDTNARSINVQAEFFQKHLSPWVRVCCEQILKSPLANVYKPVAQFAMEFLALELEHFSLAYEGRTT
jgi:TorA maturation chaperone TorD